MHTIIDKKDKNIKPPLRTIFMGTPDFAVASLEALIADNRFSICAVVTQPDKKIGRQQIINEPPIKKIALKKNLKIFQPQRIMEICDDIKNLKPDIIVVAAYAKIIPEVILNIPTLACVNIHASLLPRHRGASCIQAAILSGDLETGITFMKMDAGLDTGDIIKQFKTVIGDTDNSASLSNRLSQVAAANICDTLISFAEKPTHFPQDHTQATMTTMSRKEDALLDWSQMACKIDRHIRAMCPWPGAYSYIELGTKKSKLKIIDHSITDIRSQSLPGIYYRQGHILYVSCADKLIELKSVQLEGKQVSSSRDFILGYGRYLKELQ